MYRTRIVNGTLVAGSRIGFPSIINIGPRMANALQHDEWMFVSSKHEIASLYTGNPAVGVVAFLDPRGKCHAPKPECHPGAWCSRDAKGAITCVCKDGYKGDGTNCVKQ